MKTKKNIILLLIVVFIFLISSCDLLNINQTSSNRENIKISGKISNNVSKSLSKTISSENTLWLIPIFSHPDYSISPDVFNNKIEFEINDDGSFSVELNNNYDKYIILVMDLSQEKKNDQIVGYINLDGLILFPEEEIEDNLDLGNMELIEDELTSQTSLEEVVTKFNYNLNELELIGKMDDTLKTLKNHYLNLDTKTYITQNYQIKANINKIINGNGAFNYSITDYGFHFYSPTYFNNSSIAKLENSTDNTKYYNLNSCYPNINSATKYFIYSSNINFISSGIWKLKDCSGDNRGEYIISLYNIKDEMGNIKIVLPHISLTTNDNILSEIVLNWKIGSTNISGEIAKKFIDENTIWIQSDIFNTIGTWNDGGITINDDFTKLILDDPINIDNINNLQFGYNSNLGGIELVFNEY